MAKLAAKLSAKPLSMALLNFPSTGARHRCVPGKSVLQLQILCVKEL
jgi:hypothetical protein